MELNQEPVNAGIEEVAQPQEVVENVEVVTAEETTPTEKPQQNKDENSKYAAARREAEAEARALKEKISRLEGLAVKGGYESVESFAEAYERQLSEYEVQQRREQLEDQGIDPDVYEQMLQNDPRLKEYNEIKKAEQFKADNQKNIFEFLEYFESANGRPYDAKTDKLSQEVEDLAQRGIPLLVAYKAVAETNDLKTQLAQLKAQIEAQETNKRNATSSTGSIDPNAPQDGLFISKEVFEANKSNQQWVIKNLEKLTQSRKKW